MARDISDANWEGVDRAIKDFNQKLHDGLNTVNKMAQAITQLNIEIAEMKNRINIIASYRGTGPTKVE